MKMRDWIECILKRKTSTASGLSTLYKQQKWIAVARAVARTQRQQGKKVLKTIFLSGFDH